MFVFAPEGDPFDSELTLRNFCTSQSWLRESGKAVLSRVLAENFLDQATGGTGMELFVYIDK